MKTHIRKCLPIFLLLTVASMSAQTYNGKQADIDAILNSIEVFSGHVVSGDHEAIGKMYTEDAKILPGNTLIIEGRAAIDEYWTPGEGSSIEYHKILPEEITIVKDIAYDYGYYEGRSKNSDGTTADWKGKYVIVWKKVKGEWLVYIDIWNRVQ